MIFIFLEINLNNIVIYRNQIPMFRDNTAEFLMSFETHSQEDDQVQMQNCFDLPSSGNQSGSAKIHYNSNSEEKERAERKGNDWPQENENVAQERKQRRIQKRPSIISSANSKTRKFSQHHFNTNKIRKFQLNNEQCHKSEKSSGSKKNETQKEIQDFSDKKSHGRNLQAHQIEGSFWKKLRNLQARLKNASLNYNTLMMKIKQQDQELQKQNKFYKKFIQENCPQLTDKLNQFMKKCREEEQNDSFFDDSSSNSENEENDEWMPIMSKIQEIKIDVTKIFESLKSYEHILAKNDELNLEDKINQQEQPKVISPSPELRRKCLLRKFSNPTGLYREKKQSFQTTAVTQQLTTNLKVQNRTICSYCQQPKPLIPQTNEVTQQIQTDQI